VDLFAGEYLPDAIYETWAAEERERLSALFLEQRASTLIASGNMGCSRLEQICP
jgi:two-component SAPR family response regulator